MIKQYIYILLLAVLISACKAEPKIVVDEIDLIEDQDVTVSNIGEQLSPEVKKAMIDWIHFQELTSKVETYTSITKGQALESAKELSELVKKVSDSIKIDLLDRPEMKIRFNVLYNHALRLDDMSTIPSITDNEVVVEVSKLLASFSSVNDKINTIYKIDDFEKKYAIKPEKIKTKDHESRDNLINKYKKETKDGKRTILK